MNESHYIQRGRSQPYFMRERPSLMLKLSVQYQEGKGSWLTSHVVSSRFVGISHER